MLWERQSVSRGGQGFSGAANPIWNFIANGTSPMPMRLHWDFDKTLRIVQRQGPKFEPTHDADVLRHHCQLRATSGAVSMFGRSDGTRLSPRALRGDRSE